MKMLPAAVIVAAVAFCACSESHQESIRLGGDPEKFPTLKTIDVDSYVSDSSYTRYRITAPLWLMYEEAAEPYWCFPRGLYALRFDNAMNENGSFTVDIEHPHVAVEAPQALLAEVCGRVGGE